MVLQTSDSRTEVVVAVEVSVFEVLLVVEYIQS
jgi:hypothetical protein